jgi:hypothetical protein
MNEILVKVKMLKNAGAYMSGDEVEVPESQAKVMCEKRKRHNGYDLVDYRVAMPLAEYERIKALPIDLGGLTLDEARELGIKNVVETPPSEIERPFHAGFEEKKDPMEGASAKQSEKINQKRKSR